MHDVLLNILTIGIDIAPLYLRKSFLGSSKNAITSASAIFLTDGCKRTETTSKYNCCTITIHIYVAELSTSPRIHH